jgi:hypothetical protein
MNEYLLEAREELKRLEHIIYVSLKYSRTVDVLTNAIERLISVFDLIIEAFLEKAKDEGKINSLAKSPALRAKNLQELYAEDEEIKKYMTFYSFLKMVLNSPFQKRREYRRHVTRIVDLKNATAEIDIDNLVNCEKFAFSFYKYAKDLILGKEEED